MFNLYHEMMYEIDTMPVFLVRKISDSKIKPVGDMYLMREQWMVLEIDIDRNLMPASVGKIPSERGITI